MTIPTLVSPLCQPRCYGILLLVLAVSIHSVSMCTYNFSGARDIIIMFDISRSVGEIFVDRAKSDARNFLRNKVVIRPTHGRIAVMEFHNEDNVVFNAISGNDFMYECEMLGAFWDNLVKFKSDELEAGLHKGLEEAATIFSRRNIDTSERNLDILIYSDGHDFLANHEASITNARNELNRLGANIYGIGIGQYSNPADFIEIIGNNSACYQNLADSEIRNTVMSTEKVEIKENSQEVSSEESLLKTVNTSLCHEPVCSSGHVCVCEEEFSSVGGFSCEEVEASWEDSGVEKEEGGTSLFRYLTYVLIALSGAGLLAGLLFGAQRLYVKVKDQLYPHRHIENSAEETVPNPYSRPAPSSHQEPIYQNSIVAEIHDSLMPPPDQPPPPVPLSTTPSVDETVLQREASYVRPVNEGGVAFTPPSTETRYANVQTENRRDNHLYNANAPGQSRMQDRGVLRRMRGTWNRLMGRNIPRDPSHTNDRDYENEDVIEDIHERAQQGNAANIGTGRFRKLKSLFERKSITSPNQAESEYQNSGEQSSNPNFVADIL